MKIKLKSSAKRVLANVFSAKVDDGNALIPENIRKDVKIFDVVGTYGTAPVTPEDLVPFRVGQRIKGVTIDPTAKTNDEIIEWLNSFSYSPNEFITLLSDGGDAELDRVVVGENDGIKMLSFVVTHDLFLYFAAEDVPGMMSKGWNIQDENNGNTCTPVTEKTTFNGDVYEIATIAEQFAFLNGTVLGAVEGEAPQETLVPFTVGQSVSAIKVDTNAKTNEELSAFAAHLDSGSGVDKGLVGRIIGVTGSDSFGYLLGTNNVGDNIVWVSKAMDLNSLKFTSAGWYLVNEATSSVQEVSGIVEFSLGKTVLVDRIDTSFSELNGTVFGAVVALGDNPTETPTQLTQIAVSDTIQGLRFDVNQTPDLGKYALGETGVYSLITSNNSEGTLQESIFKVADLSTLSLGDGLGIVVDGTKVVYSESTGWNSSLLDSNNGINLENPATVTEINSGEFWNGIWAGQL